MKIQFGRRFWIVATAVIVVFTVFVVGRNALHAVKIKRQINALTREQSYYSEKIAQEVMRPMEWSGVPKRMRKSAARRSAASGAAVSRSL